MALKIKADVLQALDAWKAGKPVRSIELGHTQRMTHSEDFLKSHPNTRPEIDLSQRIQNDQERAHAYLFDVIEKYSAAAQAPPAGRDYDRNAYSDGGYTAFMVCCQSWRDGHEGLTDEEAEAAQSLAWKALIVGWARAIAGHDPAAYIEVTNPAVVQAT